MSLSLFHLHGDLKDLRFPGLLATLSDDRFTGVFQATTGAADSGSDTGEATREVHFSDGHIAWAISTQKEESLRAFMLRNGSLTEAQWAEAEEVARGGTVRDALVTLELVNSRELTQLEKGRAEEILLALFSAGDGEYRIRERQLPPGTPDLKIDPRPLILKGVLEKCDHGLIMEEVGSLDTVFAVRKTLLDQIVPILSGEFQSVLKHVDGNRSIAQILSQTSLPDNFVCSVLAALSITGAIQKRQPDRLQARESREPAPDPIEIPEPAVLSNIEAPPPEIMEQFEEPEPDLFLEPEAEPEVELEEADEFLPPITTTPFAGTGGAVDEAVESATAPSYYSAEAPSDTSRPWFLLGGGAAVGVAALFLILMSHDAGDAKEVVSPVSQASSAVTDETGGTSPGMVSYEPDNPEEPETRPASIPVSPPERVAPPARTDILTAKPGPARTARASLASGDFADASRKFDREYSSHAGKYTIQLLTACQDDTVQRAVDGAGGSSRLFILPATVEGRRCYRVYWGTYPNQTRAQEALGREVPSFFRKDRSQPRITRLGGA